jgi:hypothetical protein
MIELVDKSFVVTEYPNVLGIALKELTEFVDVQEDG